jgi:hypothetical protein
MGWYGQKRPPYHPYLSNSSGPARSAVQKIFSLGIGQRSRTSPLARPRFKPHLPRERSRVSARRLPAVSHELTFLTPYELWEALMETSMGTLTELFENGRVYGIPGKVADEGGQPLDCGPGVASAH